VYSPDVTTDERVDARLRSLGSNAPMRSYLAVPLVCLGDVIGLLQIDSSDVDAFDEEDRAVLDGLATQVAGAIESARRWEAVQRLDDARAMFVARVSHELRTPLTIMVGLADTLSLQRDRFELGAEAADVVDRIRAAGARLRVLIDELVMVGTVESGVLLQLERAALESSDPAVVSVECPDGLHATADPRFVAQVLHLLVENAIAYAGAATLSASTSAGVVRLAVIDHGPGIPDDRKQAVFERFVRGDHGGSGWGLGLSVAARLAEAMGAPLDVRDTPGGGATFTLELR
jgi:two-component system sensor histidine kinase KdpD